MKELNGINLEKMPMGKIAKIEDLIYFEGPILSHFGDIQGNNYLVYWVDYDSEYNRWLVWSISFSDLMKYKSGTKSLREVFLNSQDEIFSVDIDDKVNWKNIHKLSKSDLPDVYIPEKEHYYSSNLAE